MPRRHLKFAVEFELWVWCVIAALLAVLCALLLLGTGVIRLP